MIHTSAEVHTKKLGKNISVWQNVVILERAVIGDNCNICANCFIENEVVIGNNVTLKNGVCIWDGVSIGDDVFIGPNATFTNDRFPRSKKYPEEYLKTTVGNGASIGANATILPNVVIGERVMVGAGAVVTRDIPNNAVVVGNPAKIIGYTNTKILKRESHNSDNDNVYYNKESEVCGVKYYRFKEYSDIRGYLTVGEFQKEIPFSPKRYFIVSKVPSEEVRGEHAHKRCEQFLICLAGSCNIVVDDGVNRAEYELNKNSEGIYIPPMIWGVQYKYSRDAILLVFASDYYDNEDYIRNYQEFLTKVIE